MKIIPLYDVGLIRGIMMHEDILPTIIDDTWDGTTYNPDIGRSIFLGVVVDEKLIGLYLLNWAGGSVLDGHAHILKSYRKKYSVDSCKAVMKYLIENVRRCKKVECFVPLIYPNVKRFLADCGFTQEGLSRKSFAHDGQLYDRWLMGITLEEMREE